MITNERQYRVTAAQLDKLRQAVNDYDIKAAAKQTKSRVLAKAQLDALQSELEKLTLEVNEYETLKSGTVETLKAATLQQLADLLIRARIAKGLSQRELAEAIGVKEQQIQRYEAERYASANLRRLADVANALGLNITEIAELRPIPETPPLEVEKDELPWDQFPVREMYHRNWFEKFSGSAQAAMNNAEEIVEEYVRSALAAPLRTAARQHVRSGGIVNRYALLAWQCRIITVSRAQTPETQYRSGTITGKWLTKLAHLSCKQDGPQKAAEFLREAGMQLIVEPHLAHTHLDGAAFLLPDGSPIVGMTLRYDRLDNFWFVLFHELAHIHKHLQKGRVESIFDDLDVEGEDIEREADEEASEILVPETKWKTALARYVRSEESIRAFARDLGIHPAIVAGKIRREANNYTILRDMVGSGDVRRLFNEGA